MAEARVARLKEKITDAISHPQTRSSLYACMVRGRTSRAEALLELPGGAAFRERVKEVKGACLENQDELLDRFVSNLEKRGTKVFLAEDGPAAIDYVLDVARERGAKTVSKSKSLTTEEIEMNGALEGAGLRVVETDLGELIIQMAGEKPYHLVFPALHKTAEEVSEIFEREMGRPISSDIDELTAAARGYLRPIFLNTDIGMTGANVGVAETGGIVIETNEGNGRLVSSIGDCHICVMGREKIVDTIEEALLMVMAHPVSSTGQCPTTYVTWMNGRSPLGEGAAGPRESHVIILDNGRTKMREDPALKEALSCIRCGACMNICPTYGVVGGHTFGYIYPGPIGIPWTAAVHGLDRAADFAALCISCGLCKEICPADIDMPLMIAEVKHRAHEIEAPTRAEKTMMAADRFAALGSATAPVSNWLLRNRPFRALLERVTGLDRRRALPPFARNTFARQFQRTQRSPKQLVRHKVVFFYDVYANYNAPGLGMAAVERLEAAGCEVVVPKQKPSGYPLVAYGDLARARKVAEFNVRSLAPFARDGYTILSLEPTAAHALSKTYPSLLDHSEDASLVASSTREFFSFLLEIEPEDGPKVLAGRRFGLHCSCHQRSQGSASEALRWLEGQGAEVVRIETGTCCGMGGTFGLKEGALGYDLSQAVGEPLIALFREADVEAIVSESSVCAIQLAEGTELRVLHPLEVASEAERPG